ncbi:MAG TPA: bifunctional methylenetetrahydrofolate dehydrogenase/methenyltetrahydrofolate cyclohydrolase FolD [Candidatus Limnocylindrales bacterium]|nr:bifunctional methylenetetrahydrofolate dehydrogenase/methenyltetrahydrofolate cyclohydrolase FolD [Candidatus Limnocylindrales bacterium]
MAEIIDGKASAAAIRAEVTERVAARTARGLRPPGLAVVLVGEDPASRVYVGRKNRESKETGMLSVSVELPASATMPQVLEVVASLNARDDIDGILVQMPLPAGLNSDRVISTIDPGKDVDGLHPVSQGALFTGRPGLRPCTPRGCMHLIDQTGIDLAGKVAVVVGRSVLVGKPISMMLLERHATVVMCHSRTKDLASHVARADVLIAAVGKPGLVRGEWVKPGAVVIDVGINRVDGKLVGDVEYEPAAARAAWITPVPGGVGPMTVAMLLRNTYRSRLARDRDGETLDGDLLAGDREVLPRAIAQGAAR